jgi:hypothetical protein
MAAPATQEADEQADGSDHHAEPDNVVGINVAEEAHDASEPKMTEAPLHGTADATLGPGLEPSGIVFELHPVGFVEGGPMHQDASTGGVAAHFGGRRGVHGDSKIGRERSYLSVGRVPRKGLPIPFSTLYSIEHSMRLGAGSEALMTGP